MFLKKSAFLLFVLLGFATLCALRVAAQEPQQRGSELLITVRVATGADLPTPVEVRLRSLGNSVDVREFTRGGDVTFKNLAPGVYYIEINAQGYEPVSEQTSVDEHDPRPRAFVYLKPVGAAAVGAPAPAKAQPVLAPKARKEVEKAQLAFREKKLDEAEKYIMNALKLAPGHPFVNFLAGLLYFQRNEDAKALPYLEKATVLDPNHGPSQALLGTVLFRLKKYAGAISALERALVLDPTSWQLHYTIAFAYFYEKQYQKAVAHAESAKKAAGSKAVDLSLVLGISYAYLGETEKAIPELESYLAGASNPPGVQQAREMLDRLRGQGAPQPVSATNGSELAPAVAAVPVSVDSASLQPIRENWAPPDVDSSAPAVSAGVPCSLPDVLRKTGEQVSALVKNLEKIGATEVVQLSMFDPKGAMGLDVTQTFDYVVAFREGRMRNLFVEEIRRSQTVSNEVGSRMNTQGLSAMALVFHPYYQDDFTMTCEGMGNWQGQPTWVVSFRQRSDKPPRLTDFTVERYTFPVRIKGRAWIGANSFQVVRLETDMVEPVKEIDLRLEHIAIEYSPVDFQKQKLRFWLPKTAEMYMFRRGRRYRLRHSFGEFMLFLVDVKQEIGKPKQTTPPQD